jgi:hypothetical protein
MPSVMIAGSSWTGSEDEGLSGHRRRDADEGRCDQGDERAKAHRMNLLEETRRRAPLGPAHYRRLARGAKSVVWSGPP